MPSLQGMLRVWSVYGLSSILSRTLAFLLLPLYTRVLTPSEYGIRAMVSLGLEAILMVAACGMKEAINRFYAGGSGTTRVQAASTGILTHAGLVGLGIGTGLVFAESLARLLLGDPGLAHYLRLGLIAGFFAHVQEGAFVYLRARGRAVTIAFISIGSLVALVASNLVLVVALRQGVAGIFYSEILVFGVAGTVFTIRTLRETGLTFVPSLARQMMRFGAPIMFMPFTWLVMTRADVMFLTHYGSLASVGIYALGVQCAQVLQVAVIYPFRHFWDPTQFELARDPAGGRMYRRIFQWFTFLTIVAAFGCAVAAEDVIRVMAAPAFHGAAAVVPILAAAYVLEATHIFFNSALLVRNRTALIAAVAIVTVGVNLSANAVLVPELLAVGAAGARVVAMLAMVVTTYLIARRLWSRRPDFRAFATVGGWAVALFVVSWWLPPMPLIAEVVVKVLLVAALVALAAGSGALERGDLAAAWTSIRARLRRRRAAPEPAEARVEPQAEATIQS